MPDYGQNITWESYPDYDSWGADKYWSCTDWIIWHGKLKEKYGSDEAKLIWRSAWDAQDSWEANYSWCKYEPMFNDFLKQNDLGSSNLVADALLGVGSLFIQHETVGDEVVDGNMVVPIDLLEPIIDDLLTMGRPNKKARPWLGLFGAEADGAIVVAALTEGGPAHDADVQVGDIVRAVAENEIDTLAELFRNIWSLGPAGIEVPLVLERDGEIIDVSILSVARSDMLKGPKLH